jgi:enamine deaminase RidA (YjgF/YER057c/UK114 family)
MNALQYNDMAADTFLANDRYVNIQAPPVSTFVFVSSLVNTDWLIEVEAVAVVNS